MWSVHTRNETTSQRGTLREVHADLPPCTSEAPRGEVRAHPRRESTGGKAAERGPQGGGGERPARRSRRLALYGSRIGVGDVGALRLLQCALYSPTLKESHALTSFSSTRRGGPQREESVRERFTRRPPSERSRAKRASGGNGATGPRESGSFC